MKELGLYVSSKSEHHPEFLTQHGNVSSNRIHGVLQDTGKIRYFYIKDEVEMIQRNLHKSRILSEVGPK